MRAPPWSATCRIAAAPAAWPTTCGARPRAGRHQLWRLAAILIFQGPFASAASAQVGGGISVESEYQLRGYSLSAGQPVVTGQLSYDDKSGVYLDGYVIGEFAREDVRFLGWDANIGYARRLSRHVSADVGVIRRQYEPGYPGGLPNRYTEIYTGITVRPISARLYYSPDYLVENISTLYGEVEGTLTPSRNWRVNAHVGALTYIDRPPSYFSSRAVQYDWRVGAARLLGSFEIHAAVSGGGPGRQYYYGRVRDRTAVTVGASWNF